MTGRTAPFIVDIKRFSLEDGPGIRSVVFFKGCPLRCVFCHSPETQDPAPEIAYSAGACIGCGRCAEACPNGAIDMAMAGRIRRDRCGRCGQCAETCPGKGLRVAGRRYTPEALSEILLRDLPFYRHSRGGVTMSGGECTLYPEYLAAVFEILKPRGVHIAIETCGEFDYETFRRLILPHARLIFFDVKIADPELHRVHTGKGNGRILENLNRLLKEPGVEVAPRIPLIPGITTAEDNLREIARILVTAGAKTTTLLPYNPMGLDACASLGRPAPPLPPHFMKPGEEDQIRKTFAAILDQLRQPTRLTPA